DALCKALPTSRRFLPSPRAGAVQRAMGRSDGAACIMTALLPREGSQVKGSYLRPVARHWPIGGALLLFAVAGQALANGTVSGTLKVASGSKGTLDGAVVAATSVAHSIDHATPQEHGN